MLSWNYYCSYPFLHSASFHTIHYGCPYNPLWTSPETRYRQCFQTLSQSISGAPSTSLNPRRHADCRYGPSCIRIASAANCRPSLLPATKSFLCRVTACRPRSVHTSPPAPRPLFSLSTTSCQHVNTYIIFKSTSKSK